MRRFLWNPDLAGNWRALLLVVVLVGLVGASVVFFGVPYLSPNAGFGPEWDCTAQAKGGPTCIKKVGH